MGYNNYQGQILGPFSSGEEIVTKIRNDSALQNIYVWHLGITAEEGSQFRLNGQNGFLIQVGYTGMYEIGNTQITSIVPQQSLDANTIIDYVIQEQ